MKAPSSKSRKMKNTTVIFDGVVTGIRGERIGMDKTIVRTVTDLFTVYDVTEDGYCVNEQGRTYGDIEADIIRKIKEEHPEAWEMLDYFGLEYDYRRNHRGDYFPTSWQWIACYYVKGGSEGYYFHVDLIALGGERNLIFLGKTLSEDRSDAEKIQNALARVFEV